MCDSAQWPSEAKQGATVAADDLFRIFLSQHGCTLLSGTVYIAHCNQPFVPHVADFASLAGRGCSGGLGSVGDVLTSWGVDVTSDAWHEFPCISLPEPVFELLHCQAGFRCSRSRLQGAISDESRLKVSGLVLQPHRPILRPCRDENKKLSRSSKGCPAVARPWPSHDPAMAWP